MERIIGVNTNCYHGYSIEEALESIHKAGFHYVELTATKGWTEHVFSDQSFEYLWSIKEKMQELNLIPFAMSGHCNLMDKSRLKDFITNIRLARFFECDYIVSSIGEAHIEEQENCSNTVLVENIKELLPFLKDNNLKLVLELHGEHSTGKILKEIVDLVDSEVVLINYDTANAIFYGEVNPAEDIDCCMDKLGYMHIKEKAGEENEWNFPALGKGYVDFSTIFNKLKNANNNCPLSIEIEFVESGSKNLDEVHQAVVDSYTYLKELGFKM